MDAGAVYVTFRYASFLLMFGVALLAFLNSWFFERIFRRYIPEDEDKEEKPQEEEQPDQKTAGEAGSQDR